MLDVGVLVVLVVLDVVVGVLDDVVVVVELLVVELLVVVVVVVLWRRQSLAASTLIVCAPCWRLLTSPALTEPGRFWTARLNADAAFAAAAHCPALTAWETWSSCALRLPA